ncbi:MAG: translation initiation factor IF-1 [Candidatus Paraimprobicoccus trichonymphae]|uniref:Translation initiation factor IF-1 n=1 Tax=Candidatus Paraimprobicoccus trichonymphae TaxID=3033793 RepID=A0AA48KWA1_9FIRM|nr:MAG: translation initiation factor IF-1 [Candidatus Paraimprobicoccus trichonymphae]
MEIKKGSVVISKAGRDKNNFHVILDFDEKYAIICDGKYRPLGKPKKKKFLHLKLTNSFLDESVLKCNKDIRKSLKKFANHKECEVMSKEDSNEIEVDGEVVEVLPNTTFKVKLQNGKIITAYISGKLRMNFIKILRGDMVKVVMSLYDLAHGRIIWRSKNKDNNRNFEANNKTVNTNAGSNNN